MSYQGRACKSRKTQGSGDRHLGLTSGCTQLAASYMNTLGLRFPIRKMGLLTALTVAGAAGAPPSFPLLFPSCPRVWLLTALSCRWNTGVVLPEVQGDLCPPSSRRCHLQLMTDTGGQKPSLLASSGNRPEVPLTGQHCLWDQAGAGLFLQPHLAWHPPGPILRPSLP